MMTKFTFAIAATLLLFVLPSTAQDRGFVWQPPISTVQALAELDVISSTGASALRTPVLRDTLLFGRADSLGIVFYQELDVRYRTETELLEATPVASAQLQDAIEFSARYKSGRTFGVSHNSDTANRRSCAYFSTLQGIADRHPQNIKLYYTTPFLFKDACAGIVDIRLASAIAAKNYLRNGHQQQWPPDMGFASIGIHFNEKSFSGLRSPNSAESQARYLENTLTRIEDFDDPVPALFVNRWRDQNESTSFERDLFDRRFGVNGNNGSREARGVARGFFIGNQKVFAFDAGEERRARADWMVVLCWVILSLLSLAYIMTPRIQAMTQRYFFAHGFYCQAVAEGRETTPLASISIVMLISFAFTIVLITVARHVAFSSGFDVLAHRLPDFPQWILLKASSKSMLTILLFALLYFAVMMIQSAYLSFAARGQSRISPVQALQLQIWPRWHMILLMVLSVSLFTTSGGQIDSSKGVLLAALAVLSAVWSSGRSIHDFRRASRQTTPRAAVATVLSPSILIATTLVILLVQHRETISFLRRIFVS